MGVALMGGRQHGASIRDGVRFIMSAYKEKLDELKGFLIKAEDFSKVYEFFFDSVACHREFIDLGKPSKSELLESALKVIGEEVLGKKCSVNNLQLIKIREESFFHGGCLLNGCIATVVYFSDIDVGMIAVNTVPGTGQMSFARLTCVTTDKKVPASSVVFGNRTIQ